MSKALIIYHSKTGTTRKLGEHMARICKELSIETKVIPIEAFKNDDLDTVDYLFLGCWTHGWFIINQHPDKEWVAFAKQLPTIEVKKVVLFTTYKLATGSMFHKMKAPLKFNSGSLKLQFKSKNNRLNDADVETLKTYLTN